MFLLFSCNAFGQNALNLSLPSAGSSYGSDKIRAGDIDCSNSIGGSTNFEFGVTGIIGTGQDEYGASIGEMRDVGVYGRIIIPLDGPKERINCNTLYQLELEKKRLEVQKLKDEINQLRRLQFEDQ